jgi:hypothetical protein
MLGLAGAFDYYGPTRKAKLEWTNPVTVGIRLFQGMSASLGWQLAPQNRYGRNATHKNERTQEG